MNAEVRTFRAPDTRAALSAVKAALGPEAIILSSRELRGLFGRAEVEVTAALSMPVPPPRALAGAYGKTQEQAEPRRSEQEQQQPPDPHQEQQQRHQPRSEPAFVRSLQGDGVSAELRALRRLLDETREALEQAQNRPAEEPRRGSVHDGPPLQQLLVERGVQPELASEIVAAARLSRVERTPQALQLLREALADRIIVSRPPWLPGRRRVMAMIGPPGVGKTTTIAKIAAHALMLRSRPRVALITVDHYRIGAREHLQRYGEILDVPVIAARSVGELRDAVERSASADVVLIDTAGRSDLQAIAAQAGLIRAVPEVELNLVLSASEGHQQMMLSAARFATLRPEKLIFTKLDEAAGPGCVLSAIELIRKPICCIADGQRVPEDVHAADPADLVRRMLASGTAAP